MKRKVNILLILIWALLNGTILLAQQSPKPYLLHWDEKDGLSDNNVHKVIKDQRGYLWIGTSNGLCRFDGKDFEVFRYGSKSKNSVSSNEIVRLQEDSNGNIWIGTDGGGLNVFDFDTNTFKMLRQDIENDNKGLSENRVYSFLEDKNKDMLIGYRAIGSGVGGLSVISPDLEVKEHLLQEVRDFAEFPMKVTQIIQDQQQENIYWLAGRSFFRWDRSTGECKEFPHPSFSPNYTSISGLISDTDSTILVGMPFDGLWTFNKKRNTWGKAIHKQPVKSFLKNRKGEIWLIDTEGIARLDKERKILNYEILKNGNSSPFENDLGLNGIYLIDDNLWICTNKGLYCWSTIFKQFNVKSLGINNSEKAFYPEFIGSLSENEWLFLGKKRGLVKVDSSLQFRALIPTSDKVLFRKAALSNSRKLRFTLVGTSNGLYIWKPGEKKMEPLKIDFSGFDFEKIIAWSIFIDKDNIAWVGTQVSGLLRIDLEENKVDQFLNDPNNSNSLCHDKYLFEIDEDQNGNLWICTDKGVSVLNPKTNEFLYYAGLDEIKNYVIHGIEKDNQKNIWIGTRDQGLFQYNILTHEINKYTALDGLLYNGVNELLFKDSLLWLLTRDGLCRMNVGSKKIVGFEKAKGLYMSSLQHSTLGKLPNEKVMLTYQGTNYFSLFENDDLQEIFPAPALDISSVRVLSAKEKKSLLVHNTTKVNLAANENYFAIDYKAIHFFHPRKIVYQYKLEGYDKDWINAGKINTAVYTNLPGGEYQFKVKAANVDGVWSKVMERSIFLKTPWYKTIWFYALVSLGLIALIGAFYKYRTNQIRKEENFKRQLAETEMKALRSQINPHFIFNCLNSIKGYIIENRIEDGTEYVGRFAQLIRMILNHSKEKFIPISREIEAIKHYVWLEQERLNHKFKVDFDLSFESDPDTFKIPPLLFQPYIENAIWHGLMNMDRVGHLKIKIVEQAEHLLIQILDDGIGRRASSVLKSNSIFKKPSMGLEISAGRLEQINELYQLKSRIEIEDQFPGTVEPGTKVSITFPKIKTNTHAQSNISR